MSKTERGAIKLRPHHILCLEHFVGEGYDSVFVQNLNDIVKKLDNNPIVELTYEADAICAACPHNKNGICETHDKVKWLDKEALNYFGIAGYGIKKRYAKIQEIATTRLASDGKLPCSCESCEWHNLCTKIRIAKSNNETQRGI